MFETHYYVKKITKKKNQENIKKAIIEYIVGVACFSLFITLCFITLGDVWFWVLVAFCWSLYHLSVLIKRDRDER
jgi:hypothetical protein